MSTGGTLLRRGHLRSLAGLCLLLGILAPPRPAAGGEPDALVGTVIGWGGNDSGQSSVPADLGDVVAIAAGGWHNLAVKADGTVVAWGYNYYGQTAVPPGLSGVIAVAGSQYHSVALKADGTVVNWGMITPPPEGLADVVAIAAGAQATMALKRDGTVVTWGPMAGAYDPPAGARDIVAIAAGPANAAVLQADGTLLSWWQGGAEPPLSGIVSVAVSWNHWLAVRDDGTVVAWGSNQWGALDVPPGLSDVVQVAAGYGHSVALRSDGTVVAWGTNFGQILHVPAGLKAALVSAGSGHTLALRPTQMPVILQDPFDRVVRAGDDVTLTVLAVGDPPIEYQWRFDGVDIPGATEPSLTLPNVQAPDTGAYRAVVRDASSPVTSRSAFVRVQPSPPRIVIPPTRQIVLAGSDVEVRVRARGTNPLRYQWQKDEVDIPGAHATVLRLPSVPKSATGSYRVIVRNALGTVTSLPARLDVVRPDLVVEAIAAVPSAWRGQPFTIPNAVRNHGPAGATAGPFRVHFYLSADTTITAGDRLIGSRDVPQLAGGGAISFATTTVTIPADVPTGAYYVGAIVDGRNAVAEDDESNNARAVLTPTTVLGVHDLVVERRGIGAVTSSPGGIACGTDCTEAYVEGTPVTLTATAATGWAFAGWRGACSWTGPCVVTMTRATSVSATFVEVAANTLVQGIGAYPGPFPASRAVTYRDGDRRAVTVTAVPGQVHVVFDPLTTNERARDAIERREGAVLDQVPALGHYLVGVRVGREAAFIAAIRGRPNVLTAVPHVVGVRGGVTIFEGCSPTDRHYAEVRRVLQREGGTFDECRDIAIDSTRISPWKVVKQIALEANQNTTGTTLINLSSYGAPTQAGVDWTMLDSDDQALFQQMWYEFMRTTLLAIANLPAEYRAQLVITICAGNHNMPIGWAMTKLRADPRLAGVLRDNVLVVTTTLMRGNRGGADPDLAIMNNADARRGTSYAAPAAMALLETIMRTTGASARAALRAAKIAVATNALRRLVPSEAIDKARAIVEAERVDSPGSADIVAITFTSVGATTAAVVTPALAGVSVQYTVSGTDGYYASGTRQTDSGGRVTFFIPPAEPGVVDSISVVALLSGRMARTTYQWDVPPSTDSTRTRLSVRHARSSRIDRVARALR